MDRELIIRLAREAGLKLFNDGWTSSDNGDAVTEESLERFAALVAAHERKQALAEPDSDYERGFVDGMNLQTKRSLDKAVNRMESVDTPKSEQPHDLLCVCGAEWDIYQDGREELVAAPTPRKPLTDEEISVLWEGHIVPVFGKTGINPVVFARAIERAHGIGGEG